MSSSVTAVVVHFRTPGLLRTCLPTLEQFDEVIVVDNAPGVDGAALVCQQFPWVRLVEAADNRGFGAGANLGVQKAGGDAVLLLNPDSQALPGLRPGLEAALSDHPDLWIGGCRLLSPEGQAQHSGRRFYTPAAVLSRRLRPEGHSARRHVIEGWDRTKDRPVDWVPGNGMLIRRTAFDAIGGFDARYFLYFEDVDLCLTAWRRGGQVWYLADAEVMHDERRSSSTGLNRYLLWHLRSYARFVAKWGWSALRPPSYAERLRPTEGG